MKIPGVIMIIYHLQNIKFKEFKTTSLWVAESLGWMDVYSQVWNNAGGVKG